MFRITDKSVLSCIVEYESYEHEYVDTRDPSNNAFINPAETSTSTSKHFDGIKYDSEYNCYVVTETIRPTYE